MAKDERITGRTTKTCREMLPEWYGHHIRIGFSKGSGFVFCNVCNEQTEQELQAVEDKMRGEMLRNLEAATSKLKALKAMGMEGFIERAYGKNYFPPPHKRVRAGEEYYAQIRTCERGIKKYMELSKDTNHRILDATYLECYPSIDPEAENTLIVMLEGDINGRYWLESEYLAGHVPLDDGKEEEDGASGD